MTVRQQLLDELVQSVAELHIARYQVQREVSEGQNSRARVAIDVLERDREMTASNLHVRNEIEQ